MDVAKPFEGLMPGVDTGVLTVLAGSTKPRTGRAIARLSGRSHTSVQEVLDRLVEHGLVERQAAGRSNVYTMNREHLAAPAIEELANLRAKLVNRLRGEIQGWEVPVEHASLFGSAARGDGSAGSDIDLLVIRPRDVPAENHLWRGQLEDLRKAVLGWTGNHAGIAEVDWQDIRALKSDQRPILSSLRNDAIHLAGSQMHEVVSAVEE